MINISSIWLFLLGIRPFSEFFNFPSIIFTVIITGLQIIQFMIFLQRTNGKIKLAYFTLIFLILITAYNFATLAIVNICLSVILLKKENLRKISTVSAISIFTGLFIYLSLLWLGHIHDKIMIMPKGSAHTFGYSNSNGIGSLVLQATLIFYVFIETHLSKNFISDFFVLLLLIPNYLIYKLSLGRTTFYASLVFFLIFIFCIFSFKFLYRTKKLLSLLPFILFCLAIICCKIYEQYPFLDVLFTTRFSKNAVHLNSMSSLNYIIGYRLPEGPMDSAYLMQLFGGGICSVLLFLFISSKGIKSFDKDSFLTFIPFILCMLASGFAENTFSSFSLQTVLFYKVLIDNFELKNLKRGYIC